MRIINENEFENEVIKKEGLVVVDFFATWCGPCVMLAPILEEISKETDVSIIKINVDENNSLSNKYQISSIPTIIYFKNGQIVAKDVGLKNKQEILNKIEELK